MGESFLIFRSYISSCLPSVSNTVCVVRLLDTKVMSSTYLFKEDILYNSLDELNKALSSPTYEQVVVGKSLTCTYHQQVDVGRPLRYL